MRINQIRKRLLMLMVMMSLSFVLVGCKSKYGSIPKEEEVLEEVSAVVEKENYELVNKEEIKGRPKKCIYYFKSLDRELEFTATSSLIHASFLGSETTIYKEYVSNDYADSVKALYHDEIVELFNQSDLYDPKSNLFLINDYLLHNDEVTRLLYMANQIYSAESEFNSEKWMEDNPAMKVQINFTINGKDYSGSKVCITGNMSEKDVELEVVHCKAEAEKYLNEVE